MTRQIQASVSIKKISEIYQRIKGKTLVPQPEFQRKFVWNKAHKEKFIDTILNGYPFPEIYIAQKGIDLEKIIRHAKKNLGFLNSNTPDKINHVKIKISM